MWKQLSLSAQLIFMLIAMQSLATGLGVTWLGARLEAAKRQDIDRYLDAQSDAIEDALSSSPTVSDMINKNELFKELNTDRNFYFLLSSNKGQTLLESSGPNSNSRDQLRLLLAEPGSAGTADKGMRDLVVFGEEWRGSAETITVKSGHSQATLYVANNISSSLTELTVVRRYLFYGCLAFLLVSGLATGFIVSRSTANLRRFARSFDLVHPEKHVWTPPAPATSAEETLLFDKFKAMLEAMRAASKAQKLFIANASHELKTPVAGMLMALQVTLAKPREVEEYQRVCSDLLHSVQGLKRLSTALLELISSEDKRQAKRGNIAISELLTALDLRWQGPARAKGVALSCASRSIGLKFQSNLDLLEVALGNIIDNAIKYSNAGSRVEVTLEINSQQHATIIVRDLGIGMTPATLSRLGEVFFRASESRSDELSFGIGLAHAMTIIEALEGKMAIVSTEGHGTEVTITLPGSLPASHSMPG